MQVLDFPVVSLVRFWKNHHLLDLIQRPVWRVVKNHSRAYVNAISAGLHAHILIRPLLTSVQHLMQRQNLFTPSQACCLYSLSKQLLSFLDNSIYTFIKAVCCALLLTGREYCAIWGLEKGFICRSRGCLDQRRSHTCHSSNPPDPPPGGASIRSYTRV